jgi:hypothetical protein
VSLTPPPSPALPPAPTPGSPCYFALLYSPASARSTLTTLLALADEISAGAGHGLDHSVAHLRLDWWRAEAERYARGEPQHPWLRARPLRDSAGNPLQLQWLVEAAAMDLASETLGAQPGAAVQGALFELAAMMLRAIGPAAPEASLRRTLRELGERTGELERFGSGQLPPTAAAVAASALPATLEALRGQLTAISRPPQPQLAPLLVWAALAARHAERRARRAHRKSSSALDAFADNIVAWNAARRAARGRFRID